MSSVTKTASKINPRRSALSLGRYLLVGALANELLLVVGLLPMPRSSGYAWMALFTLSPKVVIGGGL